MKKPQIFFIFFIFLTIIVSISGPAEGKGSEFVVKKIIDGDTIQLENGEIVRYIGIDTPEFLNKKDGGPEFYAREAAKYNRKLVFLKKVRLEYDEEKRDNHGRLLAYVFVKKIFVNGELVRLGYAKASVRPPNLKYKDLLVEYQRKAMDGQKGLWQEKKEETESIYIGNKKTYTLHRPSCEYASKIPEKNRIIFRSRADALKIGYIPCKFCKP